MFGCYMHEPTTSAEDVKPSVLFFVNWLCLYDSTNIAAYASKKYRIMCILHALYCIYLVWRRKIMGGGGGGGGVEAQKSPKQF